MDSRIVIDIPGRSQFGAIGQLVAEAMANNPIHHAVFGKPDRKVIKKQQQLFSWLLQQPDANVLTASIGGKLIGVANYYLPDKCQIRKTRTLVMLPKLCYILGGALPKVLTWKQHWASHDPRMPHIHFGPLAVHPAHQGQGIGSMLLEYCCLLADKRGDPLYLETDKPENVRLYEKFNFRVIAQDRLWGVDNWFMLRI